MATFRERRPGVWEVRSFAGRDQNGEPPLQTSPTVRGTKKDAQRLAAEMTSRPSSVFADGQVRFQGLGNLTSLYATDPLAGPSWSCSSLRF